MRCPEGADGGSTWQCGNVAAWRGRGARSRGDPRRLLSELYVVSLHSLSSSDMRTCSSSRRRNPHDKIPLAAPEASRRHHHQLLVNLYHSPGVARIPPDPRISAEEIAGWKTKKHSKRMRGEWGRARTVETHRRSRFKLGFRPHLGG